MIVDQLLRLAENKSIAGQTTASGEVALPNIIDLRIAGSSLSSARNIGAGENLMVWVTINSDFSSAGSSNVTFLVRSAASEDLTSSFPTVLFVSEAYAHTTLKAGTRLCFPIPANANWFQANDQRYLGVRVAVSGSNLGTTGCVLTVDVCEEIQDPAGYNPTPGTANSKIVGSIYPKSFTII